MMKALRYILILTAAILLLANAVQAQGAKQEKKLQQATHAGEPANVKLLSETKDGKGNIVRVIQYRKGMDLVTETLIIPIRPLQNLHAPINPDTLNKDSVVVMVNKSRYNVEVFYRRHIVRSYKAVFGPRPLENKCMEGDRCTPEGWFKIQSRNPQSKYNKFMLLDYPNDSATARFNDLKAKGKVPKNARMGGSVGIHGVWKGGDDLIEMGVGWTDGCIALRNKDMEELYALTGIGTRVHIKR